MTLSKALPGEAASFSEVFAEALRGRPCAVVGLGDAPAELPVDEWRRDADGADLELLSHCAGHTLDLGCGPGRLTAALDRLGHVALGVDVVAEAVDQTVARGVAALRRDLFDRLPGEGRWRTALLADGNVGIGGDPLALLRRARELVSADGRVVVELARPGVRPRTEWAALHCAGVRSSAVPLGDGRHRRHRRARAPPLASAASTCTRWGNGAGAPCCTRPGGGVGRMMEG